MTEIPSVLAMEGISKQFSGVPVLKEISFAVTRGEVRALLGANGAGKSTLIKIAAGVYKPDSGTIHMNGRRCRFQGPIDAYRAGVAVVHQETSLIPTASALQNVFLGREILSGALVLDERSMLLEYEQLSARLGVHIPSRRLVRELGAAEKKLVEIMKAVARKSSLLIMDEPTDSLSRYEIDALFRVIGDLRAQGLTIIYITHFLGEVAKIADSATILRDGCVVATRPADSLTTQELVSLMLGRQPIKPVIGSGDSTRTPIRLAARGLTRKGEFRDVSFDLHQGEVLGIVGVVGSGKTELARVLVGASRLHQGTLSIDGKRLTLRNPHQAVQAGLGMTPEDRKTHGLILEHEVHRNVSLAALSRMKRFGILSAARERSLVKGALDKMSASYASLDQKVRFLSGGNQQKCVIARWLLAAPEVLILDEATRGIDVGSKAEIYTLVRQLAAEGRSVLYLSGEASEILAVSDRVIVMQKGRIKALHATPPSEEELLQEMLEVDDER